MNDVESILRGAGEQWRAAQPDPRDVDVRQLLARGDRSRTPRLLAIGAVSLLVVVVVGVAAAGLGLGLGRGVGGPPPVGSGGDPTAAPVCTVTRPIPPFVAPSPYPASPPEHYGSDWYGSRALWAMLDRDGEVWPKSSLPHGPGGLTQKVFYWSADRVPQDDLVPAITVTGTRLDGPGTFEFGPGTNASADFGPAMLVGIEIPSAGCWELTARYREAVLSHVVLITEE